VSRKKNKLTCESCKGTCCRYIAIQIDAPTSKREYDHMRWYLLHRGVHVFVDHDGDWFVEFKTDCSELTDDNVCGAYGKRPRICREHGDIDGICEFHAEGEPHKHRFSSAREFEAYLDRRGTKWRWKKKRGK